jgi:hypothetical protein
LRLIGKGTPTTVSVGAAELPELIRHASEYANAAAKSGEPVEYVAIATRNHFSILEELACESGVLTQKLTHIFSM